MVLSKLNIQKLVSQHARGRYTFQPLWVSDRTNRFHVAVRLFSNRSQRQDKRAIEVEGDPKAPFFFIHYFYRNLRRLPQLAAEVVFTSIPLHAQLVPSNTGTQFNEVK